VSRLCDNTLGTSKHCPLDTVVLLLRHGCKCSLGFPPSPSPRTLSASCGWPHMLQAIMAVLNVRTSGSKSCTYTQTRPLHVSTHTSNPLPSLLLTPLQCTAYAYQARATKAQQHHTPRQLGPAVAPPKAWCVPVPPPCSPERSPLTSSRMSSSTRTAFSHCPVLPYTSTRVLYVTTLGLILSSCICLKTSRARSQASHCNQQQNNGTTNSRHDILRIQSDA
jgi:hypothetical protein